jgi:hypothetical protein
MAESLRGLDTVKGRQVVIITVIFLLVVYVVAGLRVWAQMIVGRRVEVHDYLAFAALICLTGFAIDTVLCKFGLWKLWIVSNLVLRCLPRDCWNASR